MHIKKDDIPLVAAPLDELWIEFQDQPAQAVIWLSSLTDAASVEIASGETNDPSLLTAPVVVTPAQKGVVSLTTLPIPAGNLKHRYVRVRPTAGRISVSVAGPHVFSHYMRVLIT
jgi:hypothetical protein